MPGTRKYKILKLKIELDETQVWRKFQVNANVNFSYLHEIIQIVMGWENYHLYEFNVNDNPILPEDEDFENPPSKYSTETPLKKALTRKGQKFKYIYDFGDNWKHTLTVEDIIKYDYQDIADDYENFIKKTLPHCLDGAKKCPPEDVGGIDGYLSFVESMNTKDEEYEENVEWFGSHYDENEFNIKTVNKRLSKEL